MGAGPRSVRRYFRTLSANLLGRFTPMTAGLFTSLFLVAFAISLALQLWLAHRQRRHVLAHRDAVPAHFDARISLPAHQKAADYTVARSRLSVADIVLDAIVLLVLTLGGGLALIAR